MTHSRTHSKSHSKTRPIIISLCILMLTLVPVPCGLATDASPVIDSAMTWQQAISGKQSETPPSIMKNLILMDIEYLGYDSMIHRGQMVIDRRLADDIRHAFTVALREKFPIQSIIPLAHPSFKWSDTRSMATNNTSAFNYRKVTGGKGLSRHAYGQAIDINPGQNPYIRSGKASPAGAMYTPSIPGTLTASSPIVRELKQRGWKWGGDYKRLKDYQHLEKRLRQ